MNNSGKTLVYIVSSGIYQWTYLAPTLHWFVLYSSSAIHFLGVYSDRNHCFDFQSFSFSFSFSFSESVIMAAWYIFCLYWNWLSHALLSAIPPPGLSLISLHQFLFGWVILRLTISKIFIPRGFFFSSFFNSLCTWIKILGLPLDFCFLAGHGFNIKY